MKQILKLFLALVMIAALALNIISCDAIDINGMLNGDDSIGNVGDSENPDNGGDEDTDESRNPESPDDSDSPSDSEDSDNTEDSKDPENPDTPTNPDGPTEPDVPAEPEDPEEPENPDTPTEPDVPAEPEDPKDPVIDPDTPNDPTSPSEPEEEEQVVYKDINVNAYGGFVVPAYSGDKYYVINNNVPFFTENEIVTNSYEHYYPLDSLGRVTLAMSCLGKDRMPTEPRGDIGSVTPTGWNQASYSVVSGGYLYNRCHLIAFQLTGENANRENLLTGTRYMNATMIPFENQIADYIKETNNHVMYRITPVFTGNNLVCDGVILEAYSVEDGGDAISFNLFIYNVQPYIDINYADGSSRCVVKEEVKDDENDDAVDGEHIYILNTSSKKIHEPDCQHVKNMLDKNKQEYSGDIDDLIEQGYTKCKACNPE